MGIALDLDNTIVPWHTSLVSPAVHEWVQRVKSRNIKLCLLTNNYGAHAPKIARALSIPLVRGAFKPLPSAFRRTLAELGTQAAAAVSVGDQIFTDVLGAKLIGMRAVYVRPIDAREFPTTKFMRIFERPVFERLRRAGVKGA